MPNGQTRKNLKQETLKKISLVKLPRILLETKKTKKPQNLNEKNPYLFREISPKNKWPWHSTWHWYQVYCWGHSYYTSATTDTRSDWHNTYVPPSSMYPLNEPCTQTCDPETRRWYSHMGKEHWPLHHLEHCLTLLFSVVMRMRKSFRL